jgi:hypothetical protein
LLQKLIAFLARYHNIGLALREGLKVRKVTSLEFGNCDFGFIDIEDVVVPVLPTLLSLKLTATHWFNPASSVLMLLGSINNNITFGTLGNQPPGYKAFETFVRALIL